MSEEEVVEVVVQTLRKSTRKMTEGEIRNASGLTHEQVAAALYGLTLRGRVRLSSFERTNPGGQAGVAMWGSSFRDELWELVEDDENISDEVEPTPRKGA